MSYLFKKTIFWVFLTGYLTTTVYCQGNHKIVFDFIGDSHYSLYNFTDAVIPYYALDSWTEMKATLWLNENRRFAPYLSILASHMGYIPSPKQPDGIFPFFWQRYIQGLIGIQYYPFYGEQYNSKFGLRIFAFGAYRHYYKKESEKVPYSNLIQYDVQVGGDYYYDNIFSNNKINFLCRNKLILSAWSNATLRYTNFNKKYFTNLLLTGNIKIGRKLNIYKRSNFFPYILIDGTWIPFCKKDCNWFENYIHFGAGIRLYPRTLNKSNKPTHSILRRFHIYVEYLDEGLWIKDSPPERAKNWDLRFGIGFSTPGFFRSKKKEENL